MTSADSKLTDLPTCPRHNPNHESGADEDRRRHDCENGGERGGERAAYYDDGQADGRGEDGAKHAARALRGKVERDARAEKRVERSDDAQVGRTGVEYGRIRAKEADPSVRNQGGGA